MSERRYDFIGKLDGRTVLGDGSVRFTARLTRIGVFDYGDHKELRVPEEVFKPESMASFKGIAVTDGHRAFVDATNWKSVAAGHVGDDVHQDGEFLVASIVVKDAAVLKKIDSKELVELSMGYTVNLDAAPGQTDGGEAYDSIQRDIVGNHAALGPVDWGRAGPTVRLLDAEMKMPRDPGVKEKHDPAGAIDILQRGLRMLSGHAISVSLSGEHADGAAYALGTMADPVKRVDAPLNSDAADAADLAASRADADAVRKERDTARAERDAASKRADTAEAERDAANKDVEKAKTDAAETAKAEASRVDARVTLLDSARGILGAETSFAGKTDREVRTAALVKVDPASKFDGKSDDYVTAAFDIAVKSVKTDRTALGKVNEIVTDATTTQTKSLLDQAHDRVDAERKQAAQAGPPAGAMVRKT